MNSGSALAEWLVRLESFSPHEIELGLDRTLEVLARLQIRKPGRVFHVAGTNGKGSSVAYAQALLSQSGERVGSYTSPHLIRFNERICVDGQAATDDEIVAAFERVDAARGDTPLTYFEFGTIAAMLVFESREVDVAILEVGMGGRLDAVNAIEPTAGLITNIALDHCAWLGEDVEAIGFEKAGIMRGGKPTVFGDADVPASVLRQAEKLGAELILAGRDYGWKESAHGWSWQGRGQQLDHLQKPGLGGDYQIANAAGVLALLEAAECTDLLEETRVNAALATAFLPGRLQRIETDHHWLLDVAHNEAAAISLASALHATPVDGKTIAIVGMLNDKDVEALVSPLLEHVDVWIATNADSGRAIEVNELARRIANRSDSACLITGSMIEAVTVAQERATGDDRILVCGSFHTVGPALEVLGIYSAGKGES